MSASRTSREAIERLVDAELDRPVPPEAGAMADALRAAWGEGVVAVLFHGSCLRDGVVEDRLLDVYLLVDRYASVHRNPLARLANAILPPNVYYAETGFGGRTVRAKCSIVALGAFERRVRPDTLHPYFWARFAQPCALLRVRDAETRARVVAALATAATTMIRETRPLFGDPPAARELWIEAFAQTYRTELRSEPATRPAELYAADAERYERIAGMLAGEAPGTRVRARLAWRLRRVLGKALAVLRLLKAAFTFAGGADYLIWKIGRHSPARIDLSAWQRRHPILASPVLFWRLYRRGGFR